MNPETVIQSEASQKEKNKYHTIGWIIISYLVPYITRKYCILTNFHLTTTKRNTFRLICLTLSPLESSDSIYSGLDTSLEKATAPHSTTLAWKIPWTEEPGRMQSMGSRRVGHDWATSLSLSTFMHWRGKWQPTPVFLPGESQGQGSLVGCCVCGVAQSRTQLKRLSSRYFSYSTTTADMNTILSV